MQENRIKILQSVSIGAILAIIFIVAITILAELYAPLKDFLKNIFYHHWIGKGILAILIFLIGAGLGQILMAKGGLTPLGLRKTLVWLIIVAVLGILILPTFFWLEFLST